MVPNQHAEVQPEIYIKRWQSLQDIADLSACVARSKLRFQSSHRSYIADPSREIKVPVVLR